MIGSGNISCQCKDVHQPDWQPSEHMPHALIPCSPRTNFTASHMQQTSLNVYEAEHSCGGGPSVAPAWSARAPAPQRPAGLPSREPAWRHSSPSATAACTHGQHLCIPLSEDIYLMAHFRMKRTTYHFPDSTWKSFAREAAPTREHEAYPWACNEQTVFYRHCL